ncbi:MAG: peptidyl-prolyl cis-trans isomerase [Rhodothermales bacterium]|nr:peptidyl-prolyl cis-trans isomerase [Rhodothermales bacterium]
MPGTKYIPAGFVLTLLGLLLVLSGCREATNGNEYVARVGDEYLYQSDIDAIISTLPSIEDSASAVSQFVDQWVTNSLLAQEARAIGLDDDRHVRRLIADSEKSVLVSSLMNQIYAEQGETVPLAEVRTYYELNKSRLKIVEPYVRVRYLSNTDRNEVREARRLLQRAMSGSGVDSLWTTIVSAHAENPARALTIGQQHHPESRLFTSIPDLVEVLPRLDNGQISAVVSAEGKFHLLQVVDRVPAGSEPYFEWVNGELTRQLTLQNRKEALARKIQELRTKALARNSLEIK